MFNPAQFKQFMQNPSQILSRLNIPQNLQNNPQAMIQHLLNNGAMSQQQFNQLQQMAKQIQNSPAFGR